MQHNKGNILYTAIAALVIMVAGLFVAIASVFWFSVYLVIMLIIKFRSRKMHYQ